jgi:two-component sensor histidine kinase
MVFHELATNAAKYGALSVPHGRVEVSWAPAPDGRSLELSWTERGGPPIEAPPARRGFGSGLLERGLARQLGGQVAIEFPREGLRCRTRLPFSGRVYLL